MPTCTTCKQDKAHAEFYIGVPRCKECHKAAVHANYQEKMKDPEWREKELDRHRAKAQRAREAGKFASVEAQRAGGKRWAMKNPHKKNATTTVQRAIIAGKLKKAPCEVCGEVKSEAHHDDYSKPLDVRWLCKKHHMQHHVEMRRMERLTRDLINQQNEQAA